MITREGFIKNLDRASAQRTTAEIEKSRAKHPGYTFIFWDDDPYGTGKPFECGENLRCARKVLLSAWENYLSAEKALETAITLLEEPST